MTPKPDPATELNLTGDQTPDQQAVPTPNATPTTMSEQEQPPVPSRLDLPENPTSAGVATATHSVESWGISMRVAISSLARIAIRINEKGSRTSWAGAFLVVVALALLSAYLGGEVFLRPGASDPLRIQVAAGFGGTVLLAGLAFLLLHRSRRKP